MTDKREVNAMPSGVGIRGGSATSAFHELLLGTQSAFASEFDPAPIPASRSQFRRHFPDLLAKFEALRQRSDRRTEIAHHLFDASTRFFVYHENGESRPLADALREDDRPLALESVRFRGQAGVRPSVRVGDRTLHGNALNTFLDRLHVSGRMTGPAREAFRWLAGFAEQGPNGLDLSGRRVAVLGAGAALAPIELLLRGGAEVLWLDLRAPDDMLTHRDDLAGRLHWPTQGADLIAQPRRVVRTVEAFAENGPIDLGLFAYAPGRGREWLLTASMNAIVAALSPLSVRTLSMFISPASPLRLTDEEVARADRQRHQASSWKKSMAAMGLLGRGEGHYSDGQVSVARAVIAMQGVSYQAAQYIDKIMAAETWCTLGAQGGARKAQYHVSANTAAITATPSMQKPVFEIAFRGAPSFEIDIFEPATTQDLNGLLMVRDWLDPSAPGNPSAPFPCPLDRVEALNAIKIHGGAHGIAYPAEPTIRMSALVSLARNPGQILSLFRGR
ncbi:hypothetical protein [Pseudomarimonas salicorniae]|uniref:Uncharacterized protein n=1 Tax=Pseudomarimonas salicorniae TaxID=2933270 RepID=A0ABT0GG29_9GAMM|nr:hypothetical protein [Lysobacter sp. CAU 1642]MCK7593496.1 hypothetical protein [Lysobacter sp. CAU 1642]